MPPEPLEQTTDTLSPDDLARACADAMWKDDDASRGLGMEILDIKPGRATLGMTVKSNMVNGQGIAHGGFIFTLADSAFAFACNSYNERVVAAQGNITFIRPGKTGDRLIATAREISRSGRSGRVPIHLYLALASDFSWDWLIWRLLSFRRPRP